MTESRITVKLEPELEPQRLEDRRDVNAEIDVAVDQKLRKTSLLGLLLVSLGILALLAGSVVFALNYPQNWYASTSDPDAVAGARLLIKTVVVLFGLGVVLLFAGAAAFFHGRSVLGSGHLDHFTTEEVEVTR